MVIPLSERCWRLSARISDGPQSLVCLYLKASGRHSSPSHLLRNARPQQVDVRMTVIDKRKKVVVVAERGVQWPSTLWPFVMSLNRPLEVLWFPSVQSWSPTLSLLKFYPMMGQDKLLLVACFQVADVYRCVGGAVLIHLLNFRLEFWASCGITASNVGCGLLFC